VDDVTFADNRRGEGDANNAYAESDSARAKPGRIMNTHNMSGETVLVMQNVGKRLGGWEHCPLGDYSAPQIPAGGQGRHTVPVETKRHERKKTKRKQKRLN